MGISDFSIKKFKPLFYTPQHYRKNTLVSERKFWALICLLSCFVLKMCCEIIFKIIIIYVVSNQTYRALNQKTKIDGNQWPNLKKEKKNWMIFGLESFSPKMLL